MNELRAQLKTALENLAFPLNHLMSEICQSSSFDATISAEQFSQLMEETNLSDIELRLALLPVAAAFAIVPISDFYVGAIARGKSGKLYFGANMEFTGHGLNNAVHAEQSAISHAWLKGEAQIIDITINKSPCGHCRQFMNELNLVETMQIQLPDQQAQHLSYYLPFAFGPNDLDITQRLLTEQHHGIASKHTDLLCQIAIQALNKSYAPYSQSFSAVALECENGEIYQGRYAENAAFNPSLSPLQMALNALNLSNQSVEKITRAVLVETKEAKISHLANVQSLLKHVNPKTEFIYLQL